MSAQLALSGFDHGILTTTLRRSKPRLLIYNPSSLLVFCSTTSSREAKPLEIRCSVLFGVRLHFGRRGFLEGGASAALELLISRASRARRLRCCCLCVSYHCMDSSSDQIIRGMTEKGLQGGLGILTHFVTCDLTSLRVRDAPTCVGLSEVRKIKDEPSFEGVSSTSSGEEDVLGELRLDWPSLPKPSLPTPVSMSPKADLRLLRCCSRVT